MRKHLQATALAVALLACPLGGAAQETTTIFEADLRALDLSLEPAARVRAFDNTRDGCWPDAATSERVVERLLADAGFEILDDNAFGPTVLLSAKGFVEDGRCFLSLDLGVYAFELTFLRHSEFAIQSLFPRNIFYHTRLALGSREEIGAMIDVEFYNLTIGFLDDLKNNRRRIRYELEAADKSASQEYWLSLLR